MFASLCSVYRSSFALSIFFCLSCWGSLLLTSAAHAQSVPQVVSVASGTGGVNWVLWNNPDSSATLWKVNGDAAGTVAGCYNYGPYSGWTARSIAAGSNGVPRILWTNTSGETALWTIQSNGTFHDDAHYGPYSGWTATALAISPSNTTPRILWKNTDGSITLWNVDAAGDQPGNGSSTQFMFNAFTGYTATALAVGGDNLPRLLWTKPSGGISLWKVDTSGGSTHQEYGPYSGWTTSTLAAGPDSIVRVPWVYSDGTLSLWKVDASGGFTYQNYGPSTNWLVKTIAVSSDNVAHTVWDNTNGSVALWNIASNGSVTQITYPAPASVSLSPTSVGSGSTSTGTVTLNCPSPYGGTVVSLSSSNTAAATVPSSVTVPAGQTSATFPVMGQSVSSATSVTITATCSGVNQTAILTVSPAPDFTLAASPASLSIAQGASGTETISITGKNGFTGTVTLSASGLPSGVTPSFGTNPTTGMSALTLSANATASVGTSTVTITGTSGSLTRTTTFSLTVTAPPTVATPASATPSPVTGTTTALKVLGASGNGENTLTYTWATTGIPPAAVAFSVNGTNAAKNTTATFTKAGSYNFQVTIKDAASLTVLSTVAVTVNSTLTGITVSPSTAQVSIGSTQQFTATGTNQFGTALSPQPTFTWSVPTARGTISTTGLYTAPTTGGSDTVKAASGSITATATVTTPFMDILLNASPVSFGALATGSASTAVTLTSFGGFSGSVALSLTGLPSGASAVFAPASPVSVSAGAAVSDTLKISTGSVAAGTYSLMLTATSGTLSHSIPLILTVAPGQSSSSVRLTDLYLTAAGALTHRIEWTSVQPVANYSGPGTVSNLTITGYNISRSPGTGGTTPANTLFWIDSQQLQFNTKYIYTVTENYAYTVTGDPKQTSGVGTVTVGSCSVTSVKTAVADNQAVDSRLDPRYSTNVFLDHNFGSTFYRGGLFTGYNSDPARVGRSLIKFALPSVPSGQYLWRAGSVCAYATRGFAAGTTSVYCQRINDNWASPSVVWSLAPTLPASSSGVAITYDGTTPINAWQNWTMFPDIYAALNGNGGTLSVGLASIDESSANWVYFAKKEYDAALAPCVLYSYGAPN